MGDVIDFPRMSEPDENNIYTDDQGNKWLKYLCHFKSYDGKTFSFEIWAQDLADAERRLYDLTQTARIEGQVLSEIKNDQPRA